MNSSGGVFIKLKLHGYIENIGDSKREIIDIIAIKNKDKLSYYFDEIKHKIIIQNDSLILVRESKEFIHNFDFKLNKETKSKYYLKAYDTEILIPIITNELIISENYIKITYLIKETNEEYVWVLEMSDK